MFTKNKVKSSSSNPTIDEQILPWVEKYRPKKISDVVSQAEVVNVLHKSVETKGLPHLLFYGPPGTGKTSTILAFSRELFGPELVKSRVLELNASDERGIQVIRNKVKNFAQSVSNATVPGYPCPPFKIVVLDEADSMTADAQAALRRIMESYSKITRFCLVCNYVSRIIEPLASRCAKFRFKSLDSNLSISRIKEISVNEGVNISDQGIEALVKASDGDLRRAIMTLQSAHTLDQSSELGPEIINDVCGVVPEKLIEELLDSCKKKSIEGIKKTALKTTMEGYPTKQVLFQLHEKLVCDPSITSKQKVLMADKLGSTEFSLTNGADDELQLLSMLISISQAY
ncbi:hypothetical protein BB558_007156 [Smittium angustum]|uniref:Replication factor C subunit 2 n=1 Tax=Smittium angustum TaxID=133377 RepID=A0A2U1IVT6_SMIAN|nr:hypothetical protein BB558_007156 [Smittium angustum]